jgi:cytosine permease
MADNIGAGGSAGAPAVGPLVGALRISLIMMGAFISLPAFMMGAELSHSLGLWGAAKASILGSCILALIATLTSAAGARTRLSTYMLIIDAFGSVGGKIVNFLFSLTLLGWFGVVATMFGRGIVGVLPAAGSVGFVPWILLGCALMAGTNLIGFSALDKMSWVTTPLKFVLVFWALWMAVKAFGSASLPTVTPAYPLVTGISVVVGGLIGGATLMPDVTRFARSPKAAAMAGVLSFGVGFAMILILSGFPSLATGERDIVGIMLKLGLGTAAVVVILLASWSTNTFNLYASTLVWASILPKSPRRYLAAGTGIVGTLIGISGLGDAMTPFLILLSVAIPPVAAIYLCRFYVAGHRDDEPVPAWRADAFVALIAGVGFSAYASHHNLSILQVPALDSLFVTAVVYGVMHAIVVRVPYSATR